jgi:hypothetical protein
MGIVSNQASLLLHPDAQFREHSMSSAARQMATVARLAIPHHDTFPPVLTVPFAVARTQRMMVARVKHRVENARRDEQLRGGSKAAPGLLGLALIGASQSSSH